MDSRSRTESLEQPGYHSARSSFTSRQPSYRHSRSNSRVLSRKFSLGGTKEASATVRAALTDEESSHASDHLINQFLRATDSNTEQAVLRLKDTLAWRRHEQVDTLLCRACSAQPNSHYLQVVGHDTLQRPVLYSIFSMAKNKSVEDNRQHMISTFEQAVRSMPAHVEHWMWVSDFHGFGMSDCDPRLARSFLDVSAKHYPERLGKFFIVGAPGVFNLLWRGLRGMVDPNTKEKLAFLPYDYDKKGSTGELASTLARDCGPDMAHWLCTEMQQNRVKKLAKQKVYPYGRAFLHPPNLEKNVILEGHDLRGLPAYQELVAARPDILVPEGASA